MAEQPWGRNERIIFPPHQPIYSYGAFLFSFIFLGFFIWVHFTFAMSPLQQAYTPMYFKSGIASTLSKNKKDKFQMLYVGNGKQPGVLATGPDVESGSTATPEGRPIPLALSAAAEKRGVVALYKGPPVERNDAVLHQYLTTYVFAGDGFWDAYKTSILLGLFSFPALLLWTVPKDIKRRKEMKYGRKLRGPDKLTPAQFNVETKGDGVGFRINEISEMIRIPERFEAQHIEIMGDTGTGKTTLINQILRQIEERGHTAIIYDPAREFIQKFYDPKRGDVVLNPLDERCPYWGPSEELRTKAEAKTLAESLYQPTDKNKKEFFTEGPQKIFAKLLESGPSPVQLAEWMASEDEIDKICAGTTLAKLIPKDSPNQRNGTLGSLGLVADTFLLLPTLEEAGGRRWVASEWAEHRKGWVFITSRPAERKALQPLHSLWIDWLVLQLLSTPKPGQTPVWFVLDELASLQRLPQLNVAITENRKSKNPLLLGFQGKGQLEEIYGNNIAEVMLSQPATKIFLRTTEPKAAEWVSDAIGKVEIERVKETHTGGTNAHKNYTVDRQIDPLVMASEITGLPDRSAILKLGNNVVRFNFDWVDLPNKAVDFIPRVVKSQQIAAPRPAETAPQNITEAKPSASPYDISAPAPKPAIIDQQPITSTPGDETSSPEDTPDPDNDSETYDDAGDVHDDLATGQLDN